MGRAAFCGRAVDVSAVCLQASYGDSVGGMMGFQFINWFPHFYVGFRRFIRAEHGITADVYDWCWHIGFWEVRRMQ